MTAVLRIGLSLGAALLFLSGCEKPPPAPPKAAQTPTPAAKASDEKLSANDAEALRSFVQSEGRTAAPPTASQPSGALPPNHPPVGGGNQRIATPNPPPGGELKYQASTDWRPIRPSSSLRRAQFQLPRAEGDNEDGEMVVFYFGPGEGGTVSANIDRWRGMFRNENGEPVSDEDAGHETFEANGLHVTLLDVSGKYTPSMMPGVQNNGPQDNFRMLAAVVETPAGPWFFRALGPTDTMAKHREAVIEMLKSAHN
ncbi:MAG: hypothetical protein KDA32_05220 [Phycisphaerales bacterium]|nr:hypothetical protein [Phycisphaerales bacterium]